MTFGREKFLLAGLLAVLMPPSFILVAAIGNAHPLPPPAWLVTRVDSAIPLVPAAVWPYVSWYPASVAILFARRDTFRRLCLAEFMAFMLCSTAHLLWPIGIERPDVSSVEGLSGVVISALYALDPPVSLFPSFHAAVAPILVELKPRRAVSRAALAVWAAAICASCVLTKQHYVLDVIGGVVTGLVALRLADVVVRSPAVSAGSATPEVTEFAER